VLRNFEVSLLGSGFKESLARMIFGLDLVLCMRLFFLRIASALLFIYLAMLLPIVLTHPIYCATYIGAS
jgi:hypothetical protein